MTNATDELFCRLAIRNGILEKADAIELLRTYRSEAETGQGIGSFAVEQGWMEENSAHALDRAIAKRAPGHVAASRKRVPGVKGKGGGKSYTPRHHVPARPTKINATPAQLAMIGVGGVVMIVSVIFLIVQLGRPSEIGNVVDTVAGKDQDQGSSKKAATRAATGAQPEPEPEDRELTADEKAKMAKDVEDALFLARNKIEQSPYEALQYLEKRREELLGLPEDLIAKLDEEKKNLEYALSTRYQDYVIRIRKARENGDDQEASNLIEDLAEDCGPEYKARAENL